jgi:putative lipoic acid-binding regulatory protein
MDKKTTDFYERLRLELNNNTSWPTKYLFKFIVPNDQYNIDQVENAFNNMGAVIDTKQSKTGKYNSISIHVQMQDAQNIIDKYLEVSTVEGIISL